MNILKTIGNKNEFAVEYQVTDPQRMLGYGKLWVQNCFYGTNQDLIYLQGYLGKLLTDILQAKPYDIDLDKVSKIDLFEHLKKGLNYSSKYLIPSSTFTDDFLGFSLRYKDDIILIWKLLPEQHIIFDDLKDYSKTILMVSVKYDLAASVTQQFKEEMKTYARIHKD